MSFLRVDMSKRDVSAHHSILHAGFDQGFFFNLHFALEFEINIDLPIQLFFWAPMTKSFPMPLEGFLPFYINIFFFSKPISLLPCLPKH